MYLLVITTLVIGLIGIYAQVLSVQAARFAASQNGLAVAMMTWHAAAVSMAASIVDGGQFPAASVPCSLTITYPLAFCPSPTGSGDAFGTVTGAGPAYTPNKIMNFNTGAYEPVHLPGGYNASLYQFNSVLYLEPASNQPYVITFVPQPIPSAANPAPGYLLLNGTMTSFSISDLSHQLQVSGLPTASYGTVEGGSVNTSDFQFALPAGTGIVDGAVAIVTSPAGF